MIALVRFLKRRLGVKTWHVESAFVLSVLVAVASLNWSRWEEWLGVAAVWLTFGHASVSDRLSEKEGLRAASGDPSIVECWEWERRYFYGKEVTWFVYFLALEAWSALVGVVVFLFHRKWRAHWRAYKSVTEETGPE